MRCNQCGWIYFGVTAEYAGKEVSRFNEFYKTLSKKSKANYGGKPSRLWQYLYCRCGNPFTGFKKATKTQIKAIHGSTLGPIVMDGK